MANRGITNQALIDAITAQTVQYYECVYIDIASGFYLTNGPRDITFGGNTYKAFGQLLSFDTIEENVNFEVPSINILVSGIDPYEPNSGEPFLKVVLENSYIDRTVTINRVFFDHDSYIDGFLLFEGKISNAAATHGDDTSSSVAMEVSSHWVDFDRSTGRQTNSNSQQYHFAGDLGFDFSKDVQKEIKWEE